MVRSYSKCFTFVALLFVGIAFFSASCSALTLLAPTEGQTVRENVKIVIPASAMTGINSTPPNPFLEVLIGDPGAETFVAALNPYSAVKKNGMLIFYWNSKATYHDARDSKKDLIRKDGKYSLKVQIHDNEGNVVDSATVGINLKNKVDRTNPAPAVKLVNNMSFGQINTYDIHSDVSVFDSLGLPILGGLGINGDYKIIQSVEDVRPDGQYMIRCRIDDGGYVSSFGKKTMLYQNEEFKPQLYRLVTKSGKVVIHNMFSKQGMYTMMDVLPILPKKPVKEGDSWPTAFNVKIDGLMEIAHLTGTSMLDSFEWQDGKRCAKIISRLSGRAGLTLLDGKIRSLGDNVNAEVTTYFLYNSGKMIRNEISLDFPAFVDQGAVDTGSNTASAAAPSSPYSAAYGNDEEDNGGPVAPTVTPRANRAARPRISSANKGTVQIKVIVHLEK